MSEKIHVERIKGGKWALTNGDQSQPPKAVFKHKIDAVLSAEAMVKPADVVVHNAEGQILQNYKIKTSRPERVMRNALISVIKARSK